MTPLERIAKGLPYEPTPPKVATEFAPGTQDKIDMMALRAEAGEDLFHDDDRDDYDGLDDVKLKGVVTGKKPDYARRSVGFHRTHTGSYECRWEG